MPYNALPTRTGTVDLNSAADVNQLQTNINYAAPAGAIIMYGGAAAPTGWLLCDGSAISRSTYSELFTAISTTFGAGDTTTTFNVPDFRGVFPKGAGTTNRAAGKDANNNYYAGTLGTYSQDKMQGHIMSLLGIAAAGTAKGLAESVTDAVMGTDYASTHQQVGVVNGRNISAPYTDGTNGTPRTGLTTEPQSLGITFIIKY